MVESLRGTGDIPPQSFAYTMADFLAFSSVVLSVIVGLWCRVSKGGRCRGCRGLIERRREV